MTSPEEPIRAAADAVPVVRSADPEGGYCTRHQPAKRPSPSSLNRPAPHLRRKIKERDKVCQRCGTGGSTDNRLRVHHRRRVADRGGHEVSKLATLCEDCHRAVHAT